MVAPVLPEKSLRRPVEVISFAVVDVSVKSSEMVCLQ